MLDQFTSAAVKRANELIAADVSAGRPRLAAEALLSSMLIGAWSAFEAMAGDLWIAAVNELPNPLACLNGTASRIGAQAGEGKTNSPFIPDSADDDDDDQSCAGAAKSISIGLIHKVSKGGFNLDGKWGHLLVGSESVKFTSLRAIRAAYSLSFSERIKKVKPDAIDRALADRGLNAAAAVRNLIVHKAGVADEEYREKCRSAPAAPRLELGEQLQLHGHLARSLAEPAVACGVKLILAVDKWMTTYRQTRKKN